MSRGSSYNDGAGGGAGGTGVEMIGGGGGFQATGKITLNKKFFVTDESKLNTAPIISGFEATQINFTRINETAFEQNVTYEAQQAGGNSNNGGVVWLQQGVRGTFEMFCGFETKILARHPRILQIVAKYGGSFTGASDPVYFPPTHISTEGGGLSSGNAKKNPMFGLTHYKEVTLTLRHTYFTEVVNQSIWNTTGKIVDKLPAGIPIPKGEINEEGSEIPRRWMMQAPAVSHQGNAWQVVQEYVMLDAAGFAEELYAKGTVPGAV